MKRTFTWGDHPDMGEGFLPDQMPNGWPSSTGQLIAHDVIEHQIGDGGCENELMALGAIWFVRGEQGALGNSMYTPEQSMGSDIARCWEYVGNGHTLNDPGRTLRLEYADDELQACVAEGFKAYSAEAGHRFDDRAEWFAGLPDDYKARTLGWLRKGYRWAARTYGDSGTAYHLFLEVARQAEPCVKHDGEYGEQVVVLVNVKGREVRVYKHDLRDDY